MGKQAETIGQQNGNGDNPSACSGSTDTQIAERVRGDLLTDPRHYRRDLKLARRGLEWDWGTPEDRARLGASALAIHDEAEAEGNSRKALEAIRVLLAIDAQTARMLPPPKRRTEHTGTVGHEHKHAVVMLPAKAAPPALPAP
jgi:hypothetical protein